MLRFPTISLKLYRPKKDGVLKILNTIGFLVSTFAVVFLLLYLTTSDQEKVNFVNKIQESAFSIQKKTVEWRGHLVSYSERQLNTGEEVIILLHGFGGEKENWYLTIGNIANAKSIIAVDLPGFGESPPPNDGLSINDYVIFLNDFTEKLSLSNFHLVGHSTGGLIAATYAAKYEKKVEMLTLISPLGGSGAQISEFREIFSQEGKNLLIPQTIEELESLMEFAFARKPPFPDWLKRTLLKRYNQRRTFLEKTFELTHGVHNFTISVYPSLEYLVSNFSGPTHIIWGEEDRILNVSSAFSIKNAKSDIELSVLKGYGHMLMFEDVDLGKRINRRLAPE